MLILAKHEYLLKPIYLSLIMLSMALPFNLAERWGSFHIGACGKQIRSPPLLQEGSTEKLLRLYTLHDMDSSLESSYLQATDYWS